jgi:branched-chain amino acid transport system ATP-binding protein
MPDLMPDLMLQIKDMSAGYGRLPVLHGVSLAIEAKQSVGLVGANGAGKTTLLRTISGVIRRWAGTIRFDGSDIGKASTDEIALRGLAHVPQDRHVFPDLTVFENLLLGATPALRRGLSRADVNSRASYWMSRFPLLARRSDQLSGVLSGGEQQMLVICRALMGGPKMILLDEPLLGLSPTAARQCLDLLAELRRDGLTMLVVDQDADQLSEAVSRIHVLEFGEIREVEAAACSTTGGDEANSASAEMAHDELPAD